MPPSEVDKLQYYEYEVYLEEINILEKKQEKEQEKQKEEYSSMKKGFSPSAMSSQMSNMTRNMSSSMPSFGSGNFSMPKISIPKF